MRVLFLLLLAVLAPVTASATVHIYSNPQFQYSFSYPDSWVPQTEPGGLPHVFKIVADEGRGTGFCQITSQKDRRFLIYPAKYQADIVQRELGPEFWMTWLAEDTEVNYLDVTERAGLGNGNATAIVADYVRPDGKQERAMLAATIHGGVKYVAHCGAAPWDFARLEKQFHSIIATMRMKAAYTPFPNGFYRDFTADRPIVFPLGEGVGSTAF